MTMATNVPGTEPKPEQQPRTPPTDAELEADLAELHARADGSSGFQSAVWNLRAEATALLLEARRRERVRQADFSWAGGVILGPDGMLDRGE